jgi:hypothetical protein
MTFNQFEFKDVLPVMIVMSFPNEFLSQRISSDLAEFKGGILLDFCADVARGKPSVLVKCGVFQLVALLLRNNSPVAQD